MNKISNKALLAMACEFEVGPEPLLMGRPFWWHFYSDNVRMHSVRVRNMGNPEPGKPDRWAILGVAGCLNKQGLWQYERLPSNRDNGFYANCRYSSAQEAIRYYQRWRQAIEQYAKEKYLAAGLVLGPKMPLEDFKKVIVNYEEIPEVLRRF